MNRFTRCLAIGCMILLHDGIAQIDPYPAWPLSYSNTDLANLDQFIHPSVSQLQIWPSALMRRTDHIRVNHWIFRGMSSSGIVAVDRNDSITSTKYGGLNTGYDGIFSIERPAQVTALAGHSTCLVMTGVHATGITGITVLLTDGVSPPSQSMLLPLPITPMPGEIFLRANIIGPYLYVLDGAGKKVVRYIDSDNDLIPDSRDTSWQFLFPATVTFFRTFLPHATSDVALANTWHHRSRRVWALRQEAGGVQLVHTRKLPAPPAPLVAGFYGSPVAGAVHVYAAAKSNSSVQLLISAGGSSGPYSTLGPAWVIPQDSSVAKGPALSSPLTEGSWLRLRNVTTGADSQPIQVAAMRPYVFRMDGYSLSTNDVVVIEGENLQLISSVVLKSMVWLDDPSGSGAAPPAELPLILQSNTGRELKARLPTINFNAAAYLALNWTQGGDASEAYRFPVQVRQ